MNTKLMEPTVEEMKTIVGLAARCFDCDAPECFEFTPEGVDACAGLHYWSGKPITKAMLLDWKQRVTEQN